MKNRRQRSYSYIWLGLGMILVAVIAFFLVRSFIPTTQPQTSKNATSTSQKSSTSSKSQSSTAKSSAAAGVTDETTEFSSYSKLSGNYIEDVAGVTLDFKRGDGQFTAAGESDINFKMLAIHQHDDGSIVLDVKTESNYPNTTETQQYRYVAFLIMPANVILTKNFQTGKNIVDITETRSNRLSMGFSLDGKNYDLSHAYAVFTADRTDDSGDVQDVIYNNLPADQAKVFGG